MNRLAVAALFSSLPLLAQEPAAPTPTPTPAPAETKAAAKLTAKAFLPDDYRNVVFADLKALRDRGIWDELEVSLLKIPFEHMGQELGFPLDDIDRITMVAAMLEAERGPRPAEVRVIEGNKGLPLPPSVVAKRQGMLAWEQERFADFDVRRRADTLLVQPNPEVLVTGAAPWIEATLSGKSKGGMPCADLLSLLSGRADALAYIVLDLDTPRMGEVIKAQVFPDVAWPDGDAPQFVSVRLLSSGDDDDPHLGAEVVLRHKQPGPGQQVSIDSIKAILQRWSEDRTKQALRAVLQKAEVTTDGADVVLRGDLGRARNAVGILATLVLPLVARVSGVEVKPQVEVEVAPPVEK